MLANRTRTLSRLQIGMQISMRMQLSLRGVLPDAANETQPVAALGMAASLIPTR